MSLKQDIATLLSAGFSAPKVADMLSIKLQVVEMLLKDEDFAATVRSGVTQKVIGGISRDDKIDSIQELLLKELHERLEFGGLGEAKVSTLANIFRIVNSAKKVVEVGQGEGTAAGAKVVNIVLPAYMKVHTVEHTVNQNNEVVAVEGRAMLTMSPNKLQQIADITDAELVEAADAERKVINNTGNYPTRLADLLIPETDMATRMNRVPESSKNKANALFAEAAAARLARLKGEDKVEPIEPSLAVGAELDLPPATPAQVLDVSVSGDEGEGSINAQVWGAE